MEPVKGPDWLEEDFRQAAYGVWRQLDQLGLSRALPQLQVEVKPYASFRAEVELLESCPLLSRDRLILRINTGCLLQLYAAIDECRDAIEAAVIPTWEKQPWDGDARAALLAAVHTLATHFIALHELSHLLCGHLNLPTAVLGVAPSGSESTPGTMVTAAYYVTEMEADNTAIQLMLHAMCFDDFSLLLDTAPGTGSADAPSLSELPEVPRSMAFRCLLAAAWIVIGLFERGYQEFSRNPARYPLPSARLYAAVDTVMQSFVSFDEVRMDANAGLHARLTDQSRAAVEQFLRDVLRPVVLALADVPDEATGRRILCGQEPCAHPAAVGRFVMDIGGLMLNWPLTTEGALELLQLQPFRKHVSELLSPWRYLKGVNHVQDPSARDRD